MKNKEKNYDLNLDSLVPFFLIGDEELKNLKLKLCRINIPLEDEKNDDSETN